MARRAPASLTPEGVRRDRAEEFTPSRATSLTAVPLANQQAFHGARINQSLNAFLFSNDAAVFYDSTLHEPAAMVASFFENEQAFHPAAITRTVRATKAANSQSFKPLASLSEDDVEEGEAGTLRTVENAPINAGLVFCMGSHPTGSQWLGKDLVSGNQGTLLASGNLAAVNGSQGSWLCLESTSQTDGGIHFPNVAGFRAANRKRTIAFHGSLDAWDGYSALIGIPYRATTWTPPFYAQGFQKKTNTTALQAIWATGGPTQNEVGSGNGAVASGEHWFVVTMDPDAGLARFYVDGIQHGGAVAIPTGSVDWGQEQPICIFNRSSTSQGAGEGTDGRCYTAAIWARILSPAEILSLFDFPQQMFLAGENTPPPDPDPDPDPEPEGEPALPETVVNVMPGVTLAELNAIAADTLINFSDGNYTLGGAIIPKAGQYWRGNTANPAAVVLTGTGNFRAFDGTGGIAAGCVIKALTITGYQCGKGSVINATVFGGDQDELAKIGAIENAAGWQVLDCRVVANACTGIRAGNGTRIARCTINDNAHGGIRAGRDAAGNQLRARDLVLEDNVIRNNCRWRLDVAWDSGGIKLDGNPTPAGQNPALAPARDNIIRRNDISDNWGPGIWCRYDVLASEIANNSIHANHHSGVILEACAQVNVHHNQIGDNCLTTHAFAPFNTNTVAVQNSKKCRVERNLLVVNRGRSAAITQLNRVGATGSGGGSPNVGPIEAVNGSALQVAISVGTSARQTIIGIGWGTNSSSGGASSAAAVVYPRLVPHIRKVTEDIGATVMRFLAPENSSNALTYFKPYWTLGQSHGIDTVFTSGFIHRSNPDTTATALANGIHACMSGGLHVSSISPQNEPDGHPDNAVPGGNLIGSSNAAAVRARFTELRNRLDTLGRTSVKVLGYEWRHPTVYGPAEYDALNAGGLIPGTVQGSAFHIYDKSQDNVLYDARWLTKGGEMWSTETGNNGSPASQARAVGGFNNGSVVDIIHYVMVASANPGSEPLAQALLDWNGVPRPWYGGWKVIGLNLQRGCVMRQCVSSDRPPDMPTTQAQLMFIRAPRQPRQTVAVGRRPDGRWQLVAVNTTHGSDTPSIHAGGHYAAVTQQITVTIPELAGQDLTFAAQRASQNGGLSTQTINCKNGVLRFTLAPAETIGMTSNPAGGTGTPGVPFSPQGSVYSGWFTGTENVWQNNTWLFLTNGAFEQAFETPDCVNSNRACAGTSCGSTLCNVTGTNCNTNSTPAGETVGGNFMCFIPGAANDHFNEQIDDTLRIAPGSTANRFPFATGSVQLMDPLNYVPDWSVIPAWATPPGNALGTEVQASKFSNPNAFKPAQMQPNFEAAKFANAQAFKAAALGGGTSHLATKFVNANTLRAPGLLIGLPVAKMVNSQSFNAAELSAGENPIVRVQSGAGSKGWQQASSPWGTSVTGFTSFAVGFNGRNCLWVDNVPIPEGATITSATIKFTSVGAASGASNWQIRVEQSPDAKLIEAIARDIEDRNLGTSDILWSGVPAWTDGQSDADTTTPSFHVQLQSRVIDAGGWAPGQAIMITWRSSTSSGYRTYATDEHPTFQAPVLTITWTP